MPSKKKAPRRQGRKGKAARPGKRKDKGGRPTLYRPEYADQALKLGQSGWTDLEVADFYGITERTLYRWKLEYPEFCQSLKLGKDIPDERVERKLFERAVGYTYATEKVFCTNGMVTRVESREHVPPETKAALNWLYNRRPEQWRNKVEFTKERDVMVVLADPTDGQEPPPPSVPRETSDMQEGDEDD
jgi:hypothetical protein